MIATLKILGCLLYLPCFCYGDFTCDVPSWHFLDVDDIYIIMTPWVLNHEQSLLACHSWGGHLVTIKSQEKGKAVQDYLLNSAAEVCHHHFPLGLSVTAEDEAIWSDGTRMKPDDYSNFKDPMAVGGCYSLQFCTGEIWEVDDCTAGRNFVCESKDPCHTEAAIWYKKELVKDTRVSVPMNQEVNMSCHTHGYFQVVSKIDFRCGNDSAEAPAGQKWLTRSFTFSLDRYMDACVCTLTLNNGETRVASFPLNLLVPPSLQQANDNDTDVSVEPGSTAVFEFEVMANPLPSGYELFVNGSKVDKELYKVTFEETGKPFHYTVKVQIQNVTRGQAGSYSFIIQNGTERFFDMPFQLRVQEEATTKKKAGESEDWPWWYLLPILLGLTTIALVAAFVLAGKSRKKEENKAGEDAEDRDRCEEGGEEAEEAAEQPEDEEDEPQTAREDEMSATATETENK